MSLTINLLTKAAYEKKLTHLLLFHGGSSGKRRETSMQIAQILNCQNPSPEGPCEICSACRKIKSENHPDVARLEPAKSTLGIEQILAWQERVYRKHYEGQYKVFLIEQTDVLTVPAANALLKVIEEPPDNTLIILSAENAEGILPTVRSRAQIVYFPNPSARDWLSQQADAAENVEDRAEAFRLSGGSPDLAASILEHGVAEAKRWIADFWEALSDKDFLKLFPLFPVEKEKALLYVQVLAVQAEEELKAGKMYVPVMLAAGKAINLIRQQVNPRLVIEVMAIELFEQGGTLCG